MKQITLSRIIALAILPAGMAFGGAAYSAAGDTRSGTAVKDDKARTSETRGDRQVQRGDRHWASELIGKNLDGPQKGEIKDLIVDTQTGDVRHAVTKISGKGKDQLYAVPLNMLKVGADNKLMLSVDSEWFGKHKGWSEDKWPSLNDRAYWGDSSTPSASAKSGPAPSPGAKEQTARDRQAGSDAHRMSKLINQNVENANGKNVGEIKDMAVNMKTQKVDFVLFGYDPGVTKAEKQYPVAINAFKFAPTTADGGEGKQRPVFNMSEDQVKNLKALDDKKRINDPSVNVSR